MPYEQSIVAQWNELMLDAIRAGSAKPTETTYQLHLVSSAIYDAWAAYDTAAYGHYGNIERPVGEHTEANKAEAVSYAAYRALVDFFPNQKATFDAFMEAQGYDPTVASTDPSTAAGVGNLAAQTVLAAREGDGSNRENGYKDTTGYVAVNSPDETSESGTGGADFDPNAWQPLRIPNGTLTDENGVPIYDNDDPSTYVDQPALTPHWGQVDAFALSSGDQFRPDAPPRLGDFSEYVDGLGNVTTNDQAYRDQFAEVMEMSATLTNREKVIAEYWADGPRTESPPGHWNQIAQDIALREGHGIDDDAKMFFALNAALFDAGIATWDAKYAYNSIRPQSAIRYLYQDQEIEAWGGPDAGTVTMLGQDWQPYQNVTFVTPPFPEFVSGHSTFSMSAANTIAAYVGSDTYYDGTTLGNYDLDHVGGVDLLGQYVATGLSFETMTGDPVVLQWSTLTEAAGEAGISRLYGGIHIQDGNLMGQELGRNIASEAELRWEALFTRGGDDEMRSRLDGRLTIAGAGDDMVLGRSIADTIEGGLGNDTICGLGGADVVMGNEGRDLLMTGRGNDSLFGGSGADELRGRKDNDLLSGGDGWDILCGGAGKDTFLFVAGETGCDEIRDFQIGVDRIVLSGFAEDAELELMQYRRATAFFVDGDHIANLKRTDVEDIDIGTVFHFSDSVIG